LQRRLAAIAGGLGVDLAELRDLHIVPLAGRDAVMGAMESKTGTIKEAAVWRGLVAIVRRIKPCLVILDTLADVFAGKENARQRRASSSASCATLRSLAGREILLRWSNGCFTLDAPAGGIDRVTAEAKAEWNGVGVGFAIGYGKRLEQRGQADDGGEVDGLGRDETC
jgi:hypothetical protein